MGRLKGIPTIISPELLHVLSSMGHGDEIVIADANFPTASVCRAGPREVRADGHGGAQLLQAILKLMPLDHHETPVTLMAIEPQDAARGVKAPIWDVYSSIVAQSEGDTVVFDKIDRFSFYERAKRAYAVVQTGEVALYGNIILKMGVIEEK
ncbi:fucose mutarotase [Anabrus simplex]|uniref:fucose mutarotase n=1 Tax=Anabrus simplex TaxID=316456 RepID=UPI0035A32D83